MRNDKTLFEWLKEFATRPDIYEKGNMKLWEDAHISKGMLAAHLSPDDDAATRKHAFVEDSVNWISQIAPPHEFAKLIDLGCGPGIYTSRLAKKGYDVTGVDISAHSIGYASAKAEEAGIPIAYHVMNYLELDVVETYDVALLIYCDYGALSDLERAKILQNAFVALKPGGKMILDVFSPIQYVSKDEKRTWKFYENGGFYKEGPHMCLYSHLKYGDNVRLDQYILVDDNDQKDVINVWDTYFSVAHLKEEVEAAGFILTSIYSDVAGKAYSEASETICVILEKEK